MKRCTTCGKWKDEEEFSFRHKALGVRWGICKECKSKQALGRSLKHLIDVVHQLHKRKVGFRSITENIDTTTSGGKLIFHVFGALAEFERDLIRERTQAGLQAARARGRVGGRPRIASLNTPRKVGIVQSLYDDKRNNITDICRTLNISRATLYRYVHIHQNT